MIIKLCSIHKDFFHAKRGMIYPLFAVFFLLTDDKKNYIELYLCVTGRGRRGGRAAEGPALEKRYPAKSGIVGSNPTLSAKAVCFAD